MLQIADLLRATSVKRWQLVKVTREQNIAEHSYSVALIADELAKRMAYSREKRNAIMVHALFHDSAEVITGDIPTPTKEKIRKAAPAIDLDAAFSCYDVDCGDAPHGAHAVIKCADYIETVLFLSEHQAGRHAAQVLAWIKDRANAYFMSSGRLGGVARDLMDELQNVEYHI